MSWCESRWQADAVSPDGANLGYFQVNAVHAARVGGDLEALFDPVINIRVAYSIYAESGGWGPWACRPGG